MFQQVSTFFFVSFAGPTIVYVIRVLLELVLSAPIVNVNNIAQNDLRTGIITSQRAYLYSRIVLAS